MPKKDIKSLLDIFIEINILLTLFCLPFSKSIVEICVTLAIATFFAKKLFVEKALNLKINRKILIGLSLFVFFNLLSIVNSQYLSLSIFAIFSKVLKWVLLFIVIADTIRTPRQLKRIFVVMLLSAVLILADGIYQHYITGVDFLHYPNRYPVFKAHARPEGKTTFPTASFPYPNDFAAWINIFLFTFLAMVLFDLQKKKRYRILTAGICVLLAFFLFLTTSRGAWLGTLPALTLLLLFNIKKFILPIIVFSLIVVLAISFVPYLRTYAKDFLGIKLSLDDRIHMWSTGWRIFKRHPIIGNGVNTFFEHFRNFRRDEDRFKRGSYAHNCFLQMAADIGLLGLASFLYFAFFALYSNVKRALEKPSMLANSFVLGLSLGVMAFLVHSFFDTNLYSLNLAALFWISMGLIEGIDPSGYEAQ